MLQYSLEVTLCWIVFYSIFYAFLRKETLFSINRWYLLGTMILGLVIPLLRFVDIDFHQEELVQSIPAVMILKEAPSMVAYTYETASFSWKEFIVPVLSIVYCIGVLFFLGRLIISLNKIRTIYLIGIKEKKEKFTLVKSNKEHLPFSFLNYVFISDTIEYSADYDDILNHELAHVNSLHSLDVLLIELINILFWFNPMIYVYKTALRQTHEYLADAAALKNTTKKIYGTMLLKQSLSGLEIALAHHFFHSHIKKRINMMYQRKSGPSAWLKYALALPVLLLLTVVFANENINSTTSNKPINIPTFEEEHLKRQLTELYNQANQDKDEFKELAIALVKEYLGNYPNHHRSILNTISNWGWENRLMIQWKSPKSVTTKRSFRSYEFPLKNIDDITIDISTLNQYGLSFNDPTDDYKAITKDNIRESLHVLYDDKPSNQQSLRDYIKFSYNHRQRKDNINLITQRFKEVLSEEDINVYDRFEKLEISTDAKLPAQLLALKDRDIDDKSMPIIWSQEWNHSISISEFVDLDQSIGAIYHLPSDEAIKVFGDRGQLGFYALMGYERPISHPQKQKELMKLEVGNFFKTLTQTSEHNWINKLKAIHLKMQKKYPKVSDWITPFTNHARDNNITLVIKDNEIIKAYRGDGWSEDRIDEDKRTILTYYSQDTSRAEEIFKVVDEMPRFPGCEYIMDLKERKDCADSKLLAFIKDNLQYPKAAKNNKIEGKVYVQFVIEKDGSIGEIKLLRDIGSGCGQSALDLLKSMNEWTDRWIPGKQDGKVVRVLYTLPFTFKIKEEEEIIREVESKESSNGNHGGTEEQNSSDQEMDTTIIYDPENFTETIIIEPKKKVSVNPLYVINGVIRPKGSLEKLNPNDIAEIKVVKDKAATEKYGDQGKNGVIEVTTKNDTESNTLENDGVKNDNLKKEPLIVINNKIKTKADMETINPDAIRSINVLKGEKAIKKYGNKGINGVVEIRLKKQ